MTYTHEERQNKPKRFVLPVDDDIEFRSRCEWIFTLKFSVFPINLLKKKIETGCLRHPRMMRLKNLFRVFLDHYDRGISPDISVESLSLSLSLCLYSLCTSVYLYSVREFLWNTGVNPGSLERSRYISCIVDFHSVWNWVGKLGVTNRGLFVLLGTRETQCGPFF